MIRKLILARKLVFAAGKDVGVMIYRKIWFGRDSARIRHIGYYARYPLCGVDYRRTSAINLFIRSQKNIYKINPLKKPGL